MEEGGNQEEQKVLSPVTRVSDLTFSKAPMHKYNTSLLFEIINV